MINRISGVIRPEGSDLSFDHPADSVRLVTSHLDRVSRDRSTSSERSRTAYGGNQFRAIRRFLRWLAIEDGRPDPVRGWHTPEVTVSLVPVFTSEELSALRRTCEGRSFAARRDGAILAVFEATGIRLSELAGIQYDPGDLDRFDLNLYGRQIRVIGKGGKPRLVTISFEAAPSVDRYLRVRVKHPLASRPEPWLGVNGRGPVTAAGIYQLVVRRGTRPGWRCTRSGSGIISATRGWTVAAPKGT